MQHRDSIWYTIAVAAVLCVVCSLAVSAAAVALRPLQEENQLLDRQRNILDATGLAMAEYGRPAHELTKDQVDELYSWVSEKLVNLETGEYVTELDPEVYGDVGVVTYSPQDAVRKEAQRVEITDPEFDIGVQYREKITRVYFVKRPGDPRIRQVVLPVYGKGLWSTLYGYLALRSDLETIAGLTFYQHGETPGLGGEVDNTRWKAQWVGLQLFDQEGLPAARVAKGPAPEDSPHAVDGLSGATITARGVTNLVRYWASDAGYGVFLDKLKQEITGQAGAEAEIPDRELESGVEQYDVDTADGTDPEGN